MEDSPLLLELLQDILGDINSHYPNKGQISFDCPVCSYDIKGLDKGDGSSGARVFFSNRYQCASCHRIDGRGGVYGTDLSRVGSNQGKERIIESILNPDAIVAPYYVGYGVTTEDGDLFVGRWDKLIDSKRHLQMILANGERVAIAYDEIADQTMLQYSLMPANLHETMASTEFRDLVQFLSERK